MSIPRDQWLDFIDDGPTYAPVQKVHCILCHRLTDPWYGVWINGKYRYCCTNCADHQPKQEEDR